MPPHDLPHFPWATSRPAFMREAEPLAHPEAWPSPPRKPQAPSILAYRALTNERLRHGEEEIEMRLKLERARAVWKAQRQATTLELNSKRKGERGQPERQTA